MNRYLIEASHDPTHQECHRHVEGMAQAGAHYLESAEWGCEAGVHSGWLFVEAIDDRDAALVVPPSLRCQARVVRLNKFSLGDLRMTRVQAQQRELRTIAE